MELTHTLIVGIKNGTLLLLDTVAMCGITKPIYIHLISEFAHVQ